MKVPVPPSWESSEGLTIPPHKKENFRKNTELNHMNTTGNNLGQVNCGGIIKPGEKF
jgi:hypothetical protein